MSKRRDRAVGALALLSGAIAFATFVVAMVGLTVHAPAPSIGKEQEPVDPDYWLRQICVQPRYYGLDECVDLKRRQASGEARTGSEATE